ncbi:glycerate kinase [Arenibacter sp. BSSL-BM3]|uniref:Glycerate kinase n=1 Tax=Arenibacter arenosicollis TaxID=2762274 RepID=A0ABR7QMY8_9FLAO|nr:glycerate kinase [Arenibacter arenosicollis]MBC8768523.1 glycerate kinase [Arenibacter arenosicollis]
MNIVIAPDSFKECLSAMEVAANIAIGVRKVMPAAIIHEIPISDGGEGVLEAIMAGAGGTRVSVSVLDPLKRQIKAEYGILNDNKTAVIEMAKASGLELLKEVEKNPLTTSTYGTGQLIKDALEKGCNKIIVGIGGSATNDGGAGMIRALGAKFLNDKGKEINEGGGSLNELHTIDLSNFDNKIQHCEVVVACDVSNPLTGINGASMVYGGQKGGNKEDLKLLDRNLAHYAKIIKTTVGFDISDTPGAGAAGGTGAGLMAFLGGSLVNGIGLILETLKIEEYIKQADVVFTGEGKIDEQTLHGKTISGIAKMAKKHNVPVIVITGKIGDNIDGIYNIGVSAVYSIVNQPMELKEAIRQAPKLIQDCAKNIMSTIICFN